MVKKNGKWIGEGQLRGNQKIEMEDGVVFMFRGTETEAKKHTYWSYEPQDQFCYPIKTIDCTPTWCGILPSLLAVLEDGNAEGRKIAKEELKRMAQIADKYVESQKQ